MLTQAEIDNQAAAKAFYGSSYEHAPHKAKLDSAYRQFNMATKASTPGISERALGLACKSELEAFAA